MQPPKTHKNRWPNQHPSPLLTHHILGILVRPRMHEQARHRETPLPRSPIQRRVSLLRCAPASARTRPLRRALTPTHKRLLVFEPTLELQQFIANISTSTKKILAIAVC